jgi:hypothetical protein
MAKNKKKTALKRKESLSPKSKKGINSSKKKAVKKGSLKSNNKTTTSRNSNKYLKSKKGAGFSSNNFNYIRALLWKTHKQDFKGYFDPDFIRKVNAIYYDCKAIGSDCTDEIIDKKYNSIKIDERRPKPFIDPELFNPQVYYNIKDVEFDTFPSYLWIVSPMLMANPSEFLVVNYFDKNGNKTGYYNTFKEWVDWCNNAVNNNLTNQYDEIHFKFIPPEYDEVLRRWYTVIAICTGSGQIYDFGFTPVGKKFEHDIQKEYLEANEDILSKKPTTEQERDSMERLRVQKANTALQNAVHDLRIKLKEKYRRIREHEIEVRLKEIEVRKQEVRTRKEEIKEYNIELNLMLKVINKLEKSAKLAKKYKDKKAYNRIEKEIIKTTNKIISLNKKYKI